jgi:molybdopterin-biosynthesis enzyme MoeA-like protein
LYSPKSEIGVIVIGDELLSGKRTDKHAGAVRERLALRQLSLSWLQYLPDDESLLAEAFAFWRQRPAVVFCFGGIGATPDDATRAAAAVAFQQDLQLHPEAEAEIVTQFGEAAYPQRIKMAWLPTQAQRIPNFYNRIPGFSLCNETANWHFFPGFPQMAWPMLDWVLAQYGEDWQVAAQADACLWVKSYESALIPLMEEAVAQWPQLKLYSLPHLTPTPEVELGFRGECQAVRVALDWLRGRLTAQGFVFTEGRTPS